MLEVRSANLMALAATLPRAAERADMRYQWIARFLANGHVDCDAVMQPFAREVLAAAARQGGIVLILDQTRANQRHQVLMLSLRLGERALPLAWRVAATAGAIGFARQKDVLDAIRPWLPADARVCLMADRFYGTPDLIALAQANGWDYRLRLKANLRVSLAGKTTSLALAALPSGSYLSGAELTHRRIRTNIGVIKDPGHNQPWLIAMSDKPSYLTTLDYAARWGIEPMFADFKSRGFGLEQSQVRRPERLARLLLVMSLALYLAVSTGRWDETGHPSPDEKNSRDASPETLPAAACPCSLAVCDASPA
jgi:Transposase DDE domain